MAKYQHLHQDIHQQRLQQPLWSAVAVLEPTAAPEALVSAAPPQVTHDRDRTQGTSSPALVVEPNPAAAVPIIAPEAVEKQAPLLLNSRQMLSSARTHMQLILNYLQSQIPEVFAEAFLDKPTAWENTIWISEVYLLIRLMLRRMPALVSY